MKIVACVKQVPDSAARMSVENGSPTWGDAPLVINPWDEFAVEGALLQSEEQNGSVTVLSVGSESAKEALKHALAMGCSEAVLVSDPALSRMDTLGVARVLAGAIRKAGEEEPVDLVFFGRQSIDSDMGLTAAQVGRILGWPVLTLVSSIKSVDLSGRKIVVERSIEEGKLTVEANLPAVVSVGKDIGEPRYPSFMGIRKASKATIPTWTLGDIGLDVPEAKVAWPEVSAPPAREVVCEMITGSTPAEIAEKLADKILEEKVL